MDLRVLRELADVVAKLLYMIFKKSWQSGKVTAGWKKGNISPIFKMIEKRTLEIPDLSTSPLVSGKIME